VPAWWPMSGLDLIPDAETALKIGRVILERYYGDSLVRRYEPYRASPNPNNADEWVVSGSRQVENPTDDEEAYMPANRAQLRESNARVIWRGGGFPALSLARRDARVTRIALTR